MSDEKKAEIIKLEDLIPSSSSFTLKMFEDFEFKLKPCTGGMLIEMTRAIGNIESLLANPNAENISKIAMSLFEYDSAVKFKKQTVKTIDVNTGDESEAEIGGYFLLMHSISGTAEQYSIYGAILKSFGYDQTRIDDLIKKIKDSMNDAVNNKINEPLKKKSKKKT